MVLTLLMFCSKYFTRLHFYSNFLHVNIYLPLHFGRESQSDRIVATKSRLVLEVCQAAVAKGIERFICLCGCEPRRILEHSGQGFEV